MLALCILVGVLLLVAVLTVGCYLFVFYVPERVKRQDPVASTPRHFYAVIKEDCQALAALPFEEVSITSFDGLRLRGRYYPGVTPDAPLHIQFHGYRSPAIRDFCGGHKLARQRGHAVLLVDQRGHGQSDGHSLTFGVKERFDCRDWAEYAAARWPGVPILLSGISMGAATVLMATELTLPAAVAGVIADCPYASPLAIVNHVCRWQHYPGWLLMPFVHLGARLFGGFSLVEQGAVTAVPHAQVPILLIHGEADAFVPCDMGRAIAAAGGERVTLHTFPEAGHGGSYTVDTLRYEAALDNFLENVIPKT